MVAQSDSHVDEKGDIRDKIMEGFVIKEYEEIKQMNDDALLEKFEELIRKGAGKEYLLIKWMRKEILKRMKKVGRIKDQINVINKIIE